MIDPIYEVALTKAFLDLHGCYVIHIETIPVIERWAGQPVWTGDVEVFRLVGHPKAHRGYAWAYDKRKGSEIVTVLELPPVNSAKAAVQAVIVAQKRAGEQN